MAEKYIHYRDNSTMYPDDLTSPTYLPEIGRDLCRVNRHGWEYGGYRIDILTENLNERDKVGLICTACSGIMKEACTSQSGDQFCSCCRNDDLYGEETSNIPVRKMINTLKCCCPLIERGCKWLGTLEDCENHLDTCGYVYVLCKLKCGAVLRRNELEKHEKDTCSQRVVKCDHCKKDFKSCELNEHLNKCPKMKVPCDLCDTQITHEDMPQHLKYDCAMVQETCQLGCGLKLTRNELKIHVKDTCVQRTILCKYCYSSVKLCDNSRHLRECLNVKVSCDLCSTQITREDMPEHLQYDCGMVQETCQLGCGMKLTRNELKIHVKDTCVQRTILCKYCYSSVKLCAYSKHLRGCPKVKVPCDLCDTQITREDMLEHLKYNCGMVQEICQLGCGVKITRNGLKFHVKETCVQRVVKCDHCKKAFKSGELNEHLNKCPKMKVPCDLCRTQITHEDMPQHLKHDCGMVQETCQLGCGVKLTRNELKIHEKDTCVQRKIACEHCSTSLKFCDYSRHLEECPKVKMTCEICSEEKYLKDMVEHLEDYCPEKMLECPFVKYKCMTVVKRKDMNNHLEAKDTKHLGLKLTAMEELISQQSEEITKQSEEITKQNEEIKKLSENNEKQNKEMMMEKENTSQQFRLLCSITETTKIIWIMRDVTNLTKKRLLESALYTVAGYRFRLQFFIDSLTIVFPETASKYVKPFIAKCTIVLSTKQINCGMLEVKQKDLTRGCVRNIISISKQDIDRYSQPSSPGSITKDLTLETYLTMQQYI